MGMLADQRLQRVEFGIGPGGLPHDVQRPRANAQRTHPWIVTRERALMERPVHRAVAPVGLIGVNQDLGPVAREGRCGVRGVVGLQYKTLVAGCPGQLL